MKMVFYQFAKNICGPIMRNLQAMLHFRSRQSILNGISPPTLVLTGILLIWLLAGCAALKEPQMESVDQVSLRGIGKGKALLNLNLVLRNPNNFGITLKKASGTVWLEGKPVGQFLCDSSIRVERNGRFNVPLLLELQTKGLLGNSLTLLLQDEVEIAVKGRIRAGKGGLFFNYPIDYKGKQKTATLLPLSKL